MCTSLLQTFSDSLDQPQSKIVCIILVQCLLNPGLLMSNIIIQVMTYLCPSVKFPGDIPETREFHPNSTVPTNPRPPTGLCKPLELTTTLIWNPRVWICSHPLLPISRPVPCSHPTCCLTSWGWAISWLIFLLMSSGGSTSLASRMRYHRSLLLPGILSVFPSSHSVLTMTILHNFILGLV